MAVFVPVANTAQFALGFIDTNKDFQENTLWIKSTSAWTQSRLTAMAAALITWWGTGDGTHSYKSLMSKDVSLTEVDYRDHTTVSGFSGISQAGLPIAGASTDAQLPPGLTKSFTSRTGLAGKSFRGRLFSVGLYTSTMPNQETGAILGSYLTNMVSALNSLITAIPAADAACTLVIASRFYQPGGPGTPTVPRAAGVTTPVTTWGYHDSNVDFQRRRAPGHSRHR